MSEKKSLAEQLSSLVGKAGSQRKALKMIESVRGTAPTKSAIDRAVKGSGTEYAMHCMISDLEEALKNERK